MELCSGQYWTVCDGIRLLEIGPSWEPRDLGSRLPEAFDFISDFSRSLYPVPFDTIFPLIKWSNNLKSLV